MIASYKQRLMELKSQYFSVNDIKKTFVLLSPFIKKNKKAYMILLSLLLVDIGLTIGFAWFFGNIADAAVQSNFNDIRWLVPIGISITLISIVTGFIYIYFEAIATYGVKKDLKNHVFQHVLRLPASTASNRSSGELVSHFTNDINSIDGVVGSNIINFIYLPLIYLTVFIFLFQINWQLSMISLLVAPAAIVSGAFFGILLRNNGREIHHLVAKMNGFLNESFQGFLTVRSFTLEKLLYRNYRKQNQELYSLEMKNAKLRGWFHSGSQLVSSLTYIATLCVGAYFVSTGVMTVGSLLIFVTLVNHLVYPLTELAGKWAGFQRSISAVERVVTVLEEKPDCEELPTYLRPDDRGLQAITFKDIHFSYDENQKVFEHFNLHIPAGQVIAIVGPSGAGKSTLFNLLQCFYRPQSGEISIGGRSIEEFTIAELRSRIAHVSQDTFLFQGTIRENLMLARPDVTEEEMEEAARIANIDSFIQSLTRGYDTEIGERGIKLSGGQKQRIAIARAVLKKAPILLLDEATSALDNETEYQVKAALDVLMEGRTTLVIAHRLSTIQHADLILVMDQGEIVQYGRHEELLDEPGLYKKLNHSFKEESKDLHLV
ncbi:ABC-type multidrug transport system fused ATPase/permease subunit [Bacillus tianshenii]|uniref:ABC-type multidrug transport system fused ATPase/permease subunit n=1 Tax=Sutcliffiella tianshenii TaxID=1463404 RepID=A0ABS2NUC4_9BACI|nr:ABC transporter ATP-binding protein [Bacillus tianshenii]MBM7618246.1 ABC-type multidrug transport system fused ATPase/permease subunit [Bacillus tianshenii]